MENIGVNLLEENEDDYEAIPNSSMAVNMMAGSLAGITEHVVMYPFDAIKTRMQAFHSAQTAYTSIMNSFKAIRAAEGATGVWRGVSSVFIGAGPSHALYFATYEKCKELFGAEGNNHNIFATGAAGACSTIMADGLMNPFDVIKQRMQLATTSQKNFVQSGLQILRSEGISAFYISYPTTLTMTVPFQSIHFIAYETAKKTLNPTGKYDPVSHCLSGALAGGIAAAITNPLDVAKTLLQTKGTSTEPSIRRLSGLIDALKTIYQRQGWIGFTRGIKPRVFANMPATAISWTTVS